VPKYLSCSGETLVKGVTGLKDLKICAVVEGSWVFIKYHILKYGNISYKLFIISHTVLISKILYS